GLDTAFDQWRCSGRLDGLLQRGGARQVELDGRTVSLLAVDIDVPARLLDETIDHAQSKAGALSECLCREKWVENLFADSRRNANASIAHCNHHIGARCNLSMRPGISLVEYHIAGFERELTAFRHGVARVDCKVEQRRGELVGIDKRGPGMFVQRR